MHWSSTQALDELKQCLLQEVRARVALETKLQGFVGVFGEGQDIMVLSKQFSVWHVCGFYSAHSVRMRVTTSHAALVVGEEALSNGDASRERRRRDSAGIVEPARHAVVSIPHLSPLRHL